MNYTVQVNPSLSPLESSVLKAFRYIVPKPEDRIALTWTTIWSQILCLVPVIYLAYLARRPRTCFIRLAVLPWTLYSVLHAIYGYTWTNPQFQIHNAFRSLVLLLILTRAIEFGLTPVGMLKKGEIEPGVYRADFKPPTESVILHRRMLPAWISDPFHLLQSMRGLSYQFSEGVHIPSPTCPQSPKSSFLTATVYSLLIHFLRFDLLVASGRLLFPTTERQVGATIFDPSLPIYPIPWRYIASTTMAAITGFTLQAMLDVAYDILTLVGVGLCGQQAEDWPPFMDFPWQSGSMHGYWGRGWHQTLRRPLILFGGYPAQWVTTTILSLLGINGKAKKKIGDIAMLFGVFIASGLFHEFAAYSFGHGFDHRGWTWFALQGPVLMVERLWRRVTGRRVRGLWGTVWGTFVLMVLTQQLFESWYERGLGGSCCCCCC